MQIQLNTANDNETPVAQLNICYCISETEDDLLDKLE